MREQKKFGAVQSVERDTFFWRVWNNIEMGICSVSLAIVTVLTFSNVIGRYVIGTSIPWSEEVCKFFVIWICFGGAAYAYRVGANIGVTYFVHKLPPKAGFCFSVFSGLVIIGFFAILLYYGTARVLHQIAVNQVSTAARIPLAIPYASVPIGSFLVIGRLLQQTVSNWREFHKREKSGSAT
jgi:C4-dicarboxylate transporter DctQ subunit